MSISSAPAATASRVSASLTSSGARPLGSAVATAATWTPLSPRVCFATPTMSPYTQTAAAAGQVGSAGGRPPPPAAGGPALPGRAPAPPGGVHALEGGQVDHPDRQVDRLLLGLGLDRPGAQGRGTLVGADL